MGLPARGSVVIIDFPYSNMRQFKRRPALALSDMAGDDMVVCQITSATNLNKYAVLLREDDHTKIGLRAISYARADKIFTIEKSMVLRVLPPVSDEVLQHVVDMIVEVISGGELA